MRELAEQIDSHVKVIDVDNSTSNVPKGPNAPEINPVPTPPQLLERFPLSPLQLHKTLSCECIEPMMP